MDNAVTYEVAALFLCGSFFFIDLWWIIFYD